MSAAFILFFVTVSLAESPLNFVCPPGCFCPKKDTAMCCLFSSTHRNDSPFLSCQLPSEQPISVPTKPEKRWPYSGHCYPSLLDLTVQLAPGGWLSKPANVTCSGHLRKLTILGDSNDGLSSLNAGTLQDLFFYAAKPFNLKSLTIEHTSLERIERGLFDKLSTHKLTDLAIRDNTRLKSRGLLVAWLGRLPELERLDLSGNKLDDLQFSRWGVDKSSRLLKLVLANNDLKHIDERAFTQFPFLEELSLANNQLTSLSLNVLNGLKSLKHLDLSGNLLTLFGLPTSKSLPPFSILLSQLTLLNLSNNPLMSGVEEPIEWWLSSDCPKHLADLYLEFISVSPATIGSYSLPQIAWSNCPGLTNVFLHQTPQLICLPHDWLQRQEKIIPSRPKLLTSATYICPLEVQVTTTSKSPVHSTSSFWTGFNEGGSSSGFNFQLLIICVIISALILTVSLILFGICLCYKRRRQKPFDRNQKQMRNQSKILGADLAKNTSMDGRTANELSAYFAVNCQLPADCSLGRAQGSISPAAHEPLFSIQRSESSVLCNEHGVPVSLLIPASSSFDSQSTNGGELHPLMLPAGKALYYPIPLVPHFDAQSAVANYRGSQVIQPSQEYAIKGHRPMASTRSQNFFQPSCKSNSFLSLGESIHSGRGEQRETSDSVKEERALSSPEEAVPPQLLNTENQRSSSSTPANEPQTLLGSSSGEDSATPTWMSRLSLHSDELNQEAADKTKTLKACNA